MSNPQWPPSGHGRGHGDSDPRQQAGSPYGGQSWNARDDLEEEELRIRLEMIRLQKRRLDSASPGGQSPYQTNTQSFGQDAAYPYHNMHQTSRPPNAPSVRPEPAANPGTYSNQHATVGATNPAFPPAQGFQQSPNYPVGSEGTIGGRLAGWWTSIAGRPDDSQLAHGQRPHYADDTNPMQHASSTAQSTPQHAQHPPGPPHQVWSNQTSTNMQQYAFSQQGSATFFGQDSRQSWGNSPSPTGNSMTRTSNLNVNSAHQTIDHRLHQHQNLSSSPEIQPSELRNQQMQSVDTIRASPAVYVTSPEHLTEDRNRPTTQYFHQKIRVPEEDDSFPGQQQAGSDPRNPHKALDENENSLQSASRPDSRPSNEKDDASDTLASTPNVASQMASVIVHTRSTSIASTEEILQTPLDKKRVVLASSSDTDESTSDEDTDDAFGEDETCNCGRSRPSQGDCHFCWPCNGTIFCDKCWDKCPPHKPVRGRVAQQIVGLPHEKSDPYVARKIFETLQSEKDEKEQELLHDRDEDSSWFGTGKDGDTGDFVFRDFGRYSRLVEELSSRRRQTRFPALVSFVGQTGAGKSSLIRLLIEALAPTHSAPEVPVVGSALHTDLPTSGDVHLYPDLSTFESPHPVFYADCEGLDGGERQPMGARKPKINTSNPRTHSFTQHIRKQHHTSEREILWATTAETSSREYHVRHLYPRLLFTFSDVIVFVMKNPRVIENVIEQLIDWAAAALETSSNQPVLPHAIIVLNAFDNTSDPALWDVNNSTVDLLDKVSRAVHQNHKFRKFAEFWREKGRQIETVETLLLSYYSSVRVVRVPEKGRPTLIHQQVQRLYDEITEACQKSRESKHQLRMLLNSDELQPYLQYAFDHFCRNLERPFDFVQASLTFHPIPSDFGGNILKMAINIMQVWENRLDGPSLIKELSFLVASCIMLDSTRRRNLGTSEKILGGYIHHCDEVLTTFCNLHWPCEYVHAQTAGRCVNVKAGHQSKGHQLENGRVIAVGEYQSDFTAEKYRMFFEYSVAFNLRCLLQRLTENKSNDAYQGELARAADIHKNIVLGPFFRHLSGAKHFVNHTACYCCLTCPPEHPLPCGHVLCTPCVQAFGTARGAFIVEVTECPMHHEDSDGNFRIRYPVFIKPSGAGVRILTLDGGGIRGIVELTILQHIETQLGANLPIQTFFDLIVGTSAGGIVALGLGANGWTVGKCITMFKSLCKKAFDRKWSLALPGFEHLISFSGRALYETSAIEGALQKAFGSQQALFAGTKEILDHDSSLLQRTTKVAVTATTTGGTPALLGNYNRNDTDDDAPYAFPRSEKPESEIKIFEAARATSAAPTIFKQFEHRASGQVYLDGAIHLNCPVGAALREQRLIWPENADRTPDIILSIGTGYNTISRKPVSQTMAQPKGLFSGVRMLYKTAVDNITTSLNAEKMWREFLDHSNVPDHLKERYIRLNLKLQKDPPRMDEVSQLEEMEKKTRSQFARESERQVIKEVADRLLSSVFYFELEQELATSHLTAEPTARTITGHFMCRFAPHSQELMALGDALRRRSRDAHRQVASEHHPYFVVRERRIGLEKSSQHILEADVIDKMIREGIFLMPRVKITLSSRRAETEMLFCLGDSPQSVCLYPISGFPRFLVDELDSGPKVQRSSSAHVAKRAQYKLDWADFERKRAEWTFTAAQHLSMQNPFQHYSSTSYVNPGDASLDFLDSLKTRYEGKTEDIQVPSRGKTIRRNLSGSRVVRWLKSTDNINTLSPKDALQQHLDTVTAHVPYAANSRNDKPAELPSDEFRGRDIPYAERARVSDPAELPGLGYDYKGQTTVKQPLPRLVIPGQHTAYRPPAAFADSGDDDTATERDFQRRRDVHELPAESVTQPRTPEPERMRRQLLRDFSPTRVKERMEQRSVLQEADAESSTELSNAPFEGAVLMHWLKKQETGEKLDNSQL